MTTWGTLSRVKLHNLYEGIITYLRLSDNIVRFYVWPWLLERFWKRRVFCLMFNANTGIPTSAHNVTNRWITPEYIRWAICLCITICADAIKSAFAVIIKQVNRVLSSKRFLQSKSNFKKKTNYTGSHKHEATFLYIISNNNIYLPPSGRCTLTLVGT